MTATDDKPKAVRHHVNVSKVQTEIDGKDYTFRLTRKGLVVRRWHSRHTKLLSFSQLLDLVHRPKATAMSEPINLHIQDVAWPSVMLAREGIEGLKLVRCCQANGWLQCFVSIDAGLYHLSVSHPRRYPTWDEIKALRYLLLPDEKTFAILFPPMAQYVNLHPNCFHLHEVPELHEGPILVSPFNQQPPNQNESTTQNAVRPP